MFYRLAVIEIRIIPLRERHEDIPYLSAAFLRACAARLNRTLNGFTPAAERVLQRAAWPGNIRELRNVIERACILSDGRILSEREITTAMSTQTLQRDVPVPTAGVSDEDPNLLSNAQRDHVERVVSQAGGNKTAAARMLGISRRSVYRRLVPRGPRG